eukprot:6213805-Pleurochrysis_carterae.AAC.4
MSDLVERKGRSAPALVVCPGPSIEFTRHSDAPDTRTFANKEAQEKRGAGGNLYASPSSSHLRIGLALASGVVAGGYRSAYVAE